MSKITKSCMQFNGYEVNNLNFELSPYYKDNTEFKISPFFKMKVEDYDIDKYKVQLIFELRANDENPLPFNISITMTGDFSINMDEENESLRQALLHENAVAIMFPFLRSILASLTTTANVSPLILPIINLADSFKDDPLKTE